LLRSFRVCRRYPNAQCQRGGNRCGHHGSYCMAQVPRLCEIHAVLPFLARVVLRSSPQARAPMNVPRAVQM
jgi:hypothetical protein